MKLFVASGIIHPESGGPATYLYRLLPQLQARGWQIEVVSYSDDTPTDTYPYPIRRIPRRSLPVRLFDYARAARPLLAWADVVYLHTLGLPLTQVGGVRPPRVGKIVGDQGWERAQRKGWIAPTLTVDAYQTADLPPIAAADRAARAREARALHGVIVPSRYLAGMVAGWGVDPARIQVIYNAPPMEPMPDTHAPISQAAHAPTLLYVGRLAAWKGVDTAIAALRNIPDARLLIAGDGDRLDSLRAAASDLGDRVRFLGRVPRADMPALMRAADYLVLYSGYEGLSHTLLEALAVGTPAIASDQGGNPEVIAHGVNGLLVPYSTQPEAAVEALTAAFTEALRPGMRPRLAANTGIDRDRFDFASMVEQTDAALRRFVR
ncbi:MAG: glycosyltransferase family 4 protein [Chloroflexota bacterium]|nr:glycosyltransferase family 4 protein [Chloroflexota bacterium]